MKFGLIGYGLWGKHHAQSILKAPGAELSGIAVNTAETEAVVKGDFPEVPVYRDYKKLLERADIDAVDVVVPNHRHAEIGVAALEAGKDLLLEKPMALTGEECDRLIEAAKKNDRILTVGHEFRISTQWGRLKDIIEAGEIGEPLSSSLSSGIWRLALYRIAGRFMDPGGTCPFL